MSNMVFLDGLYGRLSHPLLRALSFGLALCCAALIMWDPAAFANRLGGFNLHNAPTLIWATCSGLIHGVGFVPQRVIWRLFFFPPLAWLVMCVVLLIAF